MWISPYFNLVCFLLLRGESAVRATWWYRVCPFETDSALLVSPTGKAGDPPFLDLSLAPTRHSESLLKCTSHTETPPLGVSPELQTSSLVQSDSVRIRAFNIYVREALGFGTLRQALVSRLTSNIAENDLKLILPPSPPKCWDYRYAPPHPVLVVPGNEPGVSCIRSRN